MAQVTTALSPVSQVTFKDIVVSLYKRDGQTWIAGSDLGRALGMRNHRTGMSSIFTRHKDELAPHTTDCILQSVDGKARKHKAYDEPGAYLVTMFANTPRAKEVRLWLANLPKVLRANNSGNGSKPPSGSSPCIQGKERCSTKEERVELVKLVAAWRSRSPWNFSHVKAWRLIHRHVGAKCAEDMTVAQVEKAIRFVEKRIEALPKPVSDLDRALELLTELCGLKQAVAQVDESLLRFLHNRTRGVQHHHEAIRDTVDILSQLSAVPNART